MLARARARRIRFWTAGGVICAVSMLVVYGLGVRAWGSDPDSLSRQREQVARKLEETRQRHGVLQAQCLQAERRLLAAQAVEGQPDWSLLLAMLAGRAGDEIMLKQCGLICDGKQAAAQRFEDVSSPLQLRLAGCGGSQDVVSDFVLSLEETGLFSEVKLVRSVREPFQKIDVVGFEILCALAVTEATP